MNKKVLVAMSGGVDSSVAAWLLKEQGYECLAVTMKLFANEDAGLAPDKACCSLDDVGDARRVAHRLGIPHYALNFTVDFRKQVIRRFIAAYERGETPNPCVDCNRYLKFGLLLEKALLLGCDYLATGHYARVEQDQPGGPWLLKKALDAAKDQSYFLYSLTQRELAHTLFPLGGLEKSQTREIALRQGFVNAKKAESQDICFVPGGDYPRFIESYTGREYPAGDFIDSSGRIIGRHRGIIRYTVGQRRGLGVSAPRPLYVCGKNRGDNTVTLGCEEELAARGLLAREMNWISGAPPGEPLLVTAKTNYRQRAQEAMVRAQAEGRAEIIFSQPQRAVSPGQAIVLYHGDIVVGGGVICCPV